MSRIAERVFTRRIFAKIVVFTGVCLAANGAWAQCSSQTSPLKTLHVIPAEPDWPCLFGHRLPELKANPDFEIGAASTLTLDSISAQEEEQILKGMANAGVTTVAEAFNNDDGEFTVSTLVSKKTDHDAFTLYEYSAGNSNPNGFLFTMDSLELVAQIGDDDIWECTVTIPPYGTYTGQSSNGNAVSITVDDQLLTRWDWYGSIAVPLTPSGSGYAGSHAPTRDNPGGFDLETLELRLQAVDGKWVLTYETAGKYFNGDGSVAPDFTESATLTK